jgi:hypothetical protein
MKFKPSYGPTRKENGGSRWRNFLNEPSTVVLSFMYPLKNIKYFYYRTD